MSPEEPISLGWIDQRTAYFARLELVNFKRFPQLVFELSENPVVVIGANNSGKTSLQWACLLFLHAFNSRSQATKKSEQPFPVDLREDIAELIASPAFSGPSPDYGSFVRGGEKVAILTGTIGDVTMEFTIKANGVMEIHNPNAMLNHAYPKIRFAVSTPHFLFQNHKLEVFGVDNILTSSQQNLRYLWTKLDDDFKNGLLDVMQSLFSIRSISYENRKLLIEDSTGHAIDVAFVGSAMQRVLATEILFQTLLSLKDSQKIFFFEEPESFLYPSLTSAYVNSIYNRSKLNSIQLVVTSNSPLVIDVFCDTDKRVLSSISPEFISTQMQSAEVSLITASLVSQNPILLLDGITDVEFIRLVFPDWDKKYQLISRDGRDDNAILPLISYAKSKKILVAWLRDREFVLPELIQLQLGCDEKALGIPVFTWELPCIESYVILDALIVHPQADKVKHFLEELENSNQYLLGVTQGLKKLLKLAGKSNVPKVNLLKYWNLALQELECAEPNWRNVVEVIRGHDYFKGKITARHVSCLHPVVKNSLEKTRLCVESTFASHQ